MKLEDMIHTDKEKYSLDNLKDINELEIINNYDFFYYNSFFILLIISSLLIFIYIRNKYKYTKERKKSVKEISYENLININYINTKESVYTFSENIAYFSNIVESKEYKIVIKNIEKYKYKEETIDLLNEDIQDMMKLIKKIKKIDINE